VRLRTAAWLLTSSDRTVADIATSCGFADASHLGREFRKQFGATPAAYREKGGAPAEAGEGAAPAALAIGEETDSSDAPGEDETGGDDAGGQEGDEGGKTHAGDAAPPH
jgi:hypothetical protein